MVSSPFAPFKNAVLTFQVSAARLTTDSNGNARPTTAVIEVEALLRQKTKLNRDQQPGTPSSKVWLEGYIVAVVGAPENQKLILPSVITPDSPCSAVWTESEGVEREGRFLMDFTALNPYLSALKINLVNRIKGYFEFGSFPVSGDPWFDRFG